MLLPQAIVVSGLSIRLMLKLMSPLTEAISLP